ncbi:MAG: ribosome biogenesis GTPase Der [Bacteroidales bacterium]|jgi:GTP-binding protein|nr:ribosome biogenesis GTPase Der [Bacteroidales bacterium]
MRNIIAIVGRPNTGKSTLFNRLTKSKDAIVDETSGVTRDRNYGFGDWNGIEYSVIDTGGYLMDNEDEFNEEIRRQVELAVEESDVILFLVDVKDGVTPMDEDVADLLRKCNKKVLLVVNKVDNIERRNHVAEFYTLGLGELYEISSTNGSGTGELLDAAVDGMSNDLEELPDVPKICVVGRPNVGKSSIINAFIGQDRNIVTPIAGTTRDAIYTRYNQFGFDFLLVDTAGLRKKAKVNENIEFYSVMRSIRAIERSDVCILMLDATAGLESQDLNIFSLAQRNNKGIVIVVNKWDLVEKDTHTTKAFEELIRSKTAPFTDVPIVFTSVLNKQRIFKVMELAKTVYENRGRRISTSKLNDELLTLVKDTNPPPIYKDKRIKIKYITQLPTAYPAFVFFCNLPQYIKDPYKRFVENRMREMFDFTGSPMKLYFREK